MKNSAFGFTAWGVVLSVAAAGLATSKAAKATTRDGENGFALEPGKTTFHVKIK
ncbi:MAG: hypothetical protein ABSF23_12615 [Terracidiphilus sp.]|jgi:hypothetical protein